MSKLLPVQTCEFVLATDLFGEFFPEVWEQLVESDPDFTWGNNNRSMVTIERLLDHMDSTDIEYPDTFKELCEKVGLQLYVDLEN